MMERLRVLTVLVEDPSSVPKHPTTSLSLPLLLVISSQTRIEITTLCFHYLPSGEQSFYFKHEIFFNTFLLKSR